MKHPKAIPYLFMTEMWERFSYYGITAILILYMDKVFNVDKTHVYAIYGAYGALVYMTPLIGGALADKYLGSFNAVIIGSLFIALGHFVVAIHDPAFHFFYLGLAIIIVGTGLFSPNINAIVGHLYQPGDTRRDNGFTLAYMGRNIGTIIAPILCAWIAAQYDWHYAFIVAGVGMLIGLQIFLRGRYYFDKRTFNSHVNIPVIISISLLLLALTALVFFMIERVSLVGPLLAFTIACMLIILFRLARKETVDNRQRILLAFILTLFYIVFMVLLQQSGGALNLFTDSFVDRTIGGFTIETGMFQSIEPLALVILTPLYNRMWTGLSDKEKTVSDGLKFFFALLLMSSSFVLMAFAMSYTNQAGLINMQWINITYVLQAAGELFIGPIGLAMVSRLIPSYMLGLYMGFWVLGSAIANFIAAKIGAYITPSLAHGSVSISIHSYQHAFWQLSLLGFVCACLLLAVLPTLNRMTGRT